MDPGHGYLFEHVQTPPLMENQANAVYHPSSPSSDTSFPILAIAILGILTTAFLLVSYYVFVIKCCLTWHRFDLLRRFSMSQARRHEDPLMAYVQATENRGLDESLIRAIPVFRFKRGGKGEEKSYFDCAVCLNEFQEEEKLRILPNCAHAFHIDCIDIWLQSNANCPLCRSSISTTARFPIGQIIAPTPSPQDPHPFTETPMGGDEDFVVIELRNEENGGQTAHRHQESGSSGELLGPAREVSPSPRKFEQKFLNKKPRKFHHITSMGDECIDVRGKDDQFSITPIRRSFSMDSSADRQFYLSVQEIIRQNRQPNEVSPSEGSSNRIRRSFFSFGHGRGSRSAILPLQFEP